MAVNGLSSTFLFVNPISLGVLSHEIGQVFAMNGCVEVFADVLPVPFGSDAYANIPVGTMSCATTFR